LVIYTGFTLISELKINYTHKAGVCLQKKPLDNRLSRMRTTSFRWSEN
jgi:hypothetical protein